MLGKERETGNGNEYIYMNCNKGKKVTLGILLLPLEKFDGISDHFLALSISLHLSFNSFPLSRPTLHSLHRSLKVR